MYIFYVGPWEAEVISNWFEEKIQFRDYEKNSESFPHSQWPSKAFK